MNVDDQTALAPPSKTLRTVILASSAGTLIEWYDFYLFGALAPVIATQFFPKSNPTAAFLSTLATFAAGFIVRPFGAVFFGRIGDLIGRKYTFLVTLLLMGGATFAIGLVPGYEQIGILAPLIVLVLRLLQGLALGGEYGGAATYVAEHAPDHRRGYYTSWIQTTATLGFFVSLAVILACRLNMGEQAFGEWGWRVPFLISIVLVVLSYVLRMKLRESPVFERMKASGRGSATPLRDSFTRWPNLKLVLIALFGATAGQGVVWYTGQFYAQTFMLKTLNLDFVVTNTIIGIVLLAATPLFVVFGALSDRIGRKPIIMAGCLLAILSYLPIYHQMARAADLSRLGTPVVEMIEEQRTLTQGVQTIASRFADRYADGTVAVRKVTERSGPGVKLETPKTEVSVRPSTPIAVTLGALVFVQVVLVTMVYGPIAAFLVELFPTRIRYTSMSLPYHIGNGVFGGLTPFIAASLAAAAASEPDSWHARLVGGPSFVGLIYPIAIAAMTLVVGTLLIRERRGAPIDDGR
ncbi:MAG: MHS family MFS transporter [Phycisphaerales bacterium]|nr:MHS family MFS transporter [Phycisphaerales bacterium]